LKMDPSQAESSSAGALVTNPWKLVPEGDAVLGMKQGAGFGWDNEFDEQHIATDAFQIQRFKVTNGEYLEFVKQGAPAPHFWRERNGKFFLRGMFREMELPLDWPVYTTQREAELYAAHIGKSLPTEAQFHRAAFGDPSGATRPYPWGSEDPSQVPGNYDFRRWDPEPVNAPAGESAFGVSQLVGNGWEWTSTPFGPFPGFEPRPTYPGYSANFFDGEHFVMKGGSSRTAARLLRPSFRNWFRRDYPYMYAGFRCVGK
jgi:gamma-glutamyl hercynylcysteine S-oxide synthase